MPHFSLLTQETVHYIALAALAALGSCAPPFDLAELDVLTDLHGPAITVTSPGSGSTFQSKVTVTGVILDRNAAGELRAADVPGYVSTATYTVRDTDITGTIDLAGDSTFSFSLATTAFDHGIEIDLEAADRNGNTSSFTLELSPDEEGPYLEVTSPENYAYYATLIQLEGTAANTPEKLSTSEIASAAYRFLGTSISGSLTLGTDGSFSEIIDTSTLTDNVVIEITATDLNGYTTALLVNQLKSAGGSDVSNFTVTPGTGKVTFSWDPVTGATSYTLLDYITGGVEENILDTTFQWIGLQNGDLYSFQLVATVPAGADAYSSIVDVIPMSPRTLAPWFRSVGFDSLTLEWPLLESVDRYRVERSTDGLTWQTRRTTTGNALTETGLDQGTYYRYRIVPHEQTDIISDWVGTRTDWFGTYPIVAEIPMDNTPSDVDRYGDYLYASGGSDGLLVYNVSDAENPVLLAAHTYPEAAYITSMKVSGDTLYVGGQYHLFVLDIGTDPESPPVLADLDVQTIIGEDEYHGPVFDVEVSGTNVLLACRGYMDGLKVVVVSDLGNLTYWMVPMEWAEDIAVDTVDPDYVYVTNYDNGVHVVNVSNSADPSPIKATVVSTSGSLNRASGVTTEGTQLYVAYGDAGIATCDVSTPATPGSVTEIPREGTDNAYGIDAAVAADFGRGEIVAVQGDTAYGVYFSTLYSYDISDPTADVQLDSLSGFYDTKNLLALGDYLFVLRRSYGLYIVDISDPANLAVLGILDTTGYVEEVFVRGNYCFIDNGNNLTSFLVADISDPENPVIVSSAEPGAGGTYGFTVEGDYAYNARYSLLKVIDISDPLAPDYLETAAVSLPIAGYGGADADGDTLYVANSQASSGGLIIIDITDPTAPSIITTVPIDGQEEAVWVQGRFVYVVTSQSGTEKLVVVDVTDRTAPRILHELAMPDDAMDVAVQGKYAFVGTTSFYGIHTVQLVPDE